MDEILDQRINRWTMKPNMPGKENNGNMFPAAGILVFLLYALLFHEIVTILWDASKQKQKKNGNCAPNYRPRSQMSGCRKGHHSFDSLWRRMRQATQSLELSGLKQAVITKYMEQARQQARINEVGREES